MKYLIGLVWNFRDGDVWRFHAPGFAVYDMHRICAVERDGEDD